MKTLAVKHLGHISVTKMFSFVLWVQHGVLQDLQWVYIWANGCKYWCCWCNLFYRDVKWSLTPQNSNTMGEYRFRSTRILISCSGYYISLLICEGFAIEISYNYTMRNIGYPFLVQSPEVTTLLDGTYPLKVFCGCSWVFHFFQESQGGINRYFNLNLTRCRLFLGCFQTCGFWLCNQLRQSSKGG